MMQQTARNGEKAPLFGGRKPLFTQSQLLKLTWPLLVEQFLAVTVGMADTMMVSRCGEAAISGVSLVDMINNLIIVLFAALATGGAVCIMLMRSGCNPWIALLCAFLVGMLAGMVTGLLHTRCGIPAILAGILTQFSLYSINLRIMGKSNTPILAKGTVFSAVSNMTGLPQSTVAIILGILLAVAIVAILYWFFGTEIGSALRATGNNEYMIRALGVNTNSTKMIALVLSNALIGLSGALICQSQKYADIGMGTGAIVIGLAAIVIGEVLGRLLPGGLTQFSVRLASAVFGSVVYFLIRAIVLQLGMDANDMKLLSAVIVAVALCVPVVWERYKLRSSYTKGDEADA